LTNLSTILETDQLNAQILVSS